MTFVPVVFSKPGRFNWNVPAAPDAVLDVTVIVPLDPPTALDQVLTAPPAIAFEVITSANDNPVLATGWLPTLSGKLRSTEVIGPRRTSLPPMVIEPAEWMTVRIAFASQRAPSMVALIDPWAVTMGVDPPDEPLGLVGLLLELLLQPAVSTIAAQNVRIGKQRGIP